MLNTALIEEFGQIHAERRTGSLVLALGERRIRFGFQEGEFVLLDLGEEKELAMARKFLDYHKIAPEIHRHAVATARASGASIVDSLRRQQLVSDNEIDAIAQAMVEDMLSLCFGIGVISPQWIDGEGPDTYDLETRAVRLRIDIPTLLAHVQARVQEEEEIVREVGGFAAVYQLAESVDRDQLDDFERHVLNFVDGRKTVEAMAVSFRDSNANMARAIAKLARKGYVQRVAASAERRPVAPGSGPQPVVALRDAMADAAAPIPGEPGGAGFEVYRPAPPPATNWAARGALIAILLAVVAVLAFVLQYGQKQRAVSGMLGEIEQSLAAHDWAGAQERLTAARLESASDLSTIRRIEAIEARMREAIDGEVAGIERDLADQRFAEAQVRLDRLIEHPRREELQARHDRDLAEFQRRTVALQRQVAQRLEAADIAGALATIDGARPAEGAIAGQVLEHWRKSNLELAQLPGKPMGERQAILNRLRQARPTAYQKEAIDRLQEELARGQNRRQEQLRAVRALVEKGDWRRADDEIHKQRLMDQAPETPLAAEAQALADRLAEVRGLLDGFAAATTEALAAAGDVALLPGLRERLQKAVAQFPEASNRDELVALDQLIGQLVPLVGRGSTSEEATAMAALLKEQPAGSALASALTARMAALAAAAEEAQVALDSARRLGRDGRWDDAIVAMQKIAANPGWRRTPVGQAIDQEIAAARVTKTRTEQLMVRFRAALEKGDVGTANDLAREIGLRYLPLLVESIPAGATVTRDGAVIGRTPLVLDMPAGERPDLVLAVTADGYQAAELKGADAVGGWRLTAALPRTPRWTAETGATLSSQVGVADGAVWVAGPAGAVAIATGGAVTRHPIGDGPIAPGAEAAITAAPAVFDDGVWVATRDHWALRIAGAKRERLPLPAATDLAPASYRSAVVLDRRWLLVAGADGVLHAVDPVRGGGWRSPRGGLFACTPAQRGDAVLAVRNDGSLLALQVDRGETLATDSLGETVVAAWPTAQGLAGLTRRVAWTWDGRRIVRSALPRDAVAGGDGVIVTRERQVLVLGETGEWALVGQVPADATGAPLRWRGRAVVPCGEMVLVLGERGFQVRGKGLFRSPVVLGDDLVLVTSSGEVMAFGP